MKYNFIKILLGAAIVMSGVSCEKFLTAEPIDKISAESFFASESDLKLYANGLINSYRPSAEGVGLGDRYCDLVATKTSSDFYRPGIHNPSKQDGWDISSWKNIRRANVMLRDMVRCKDIVDAEVYNHYEGVARFWRAYFYYAKVKTFGNVPWMEAVVDVDDEILFAGRDDRELVMSKVLEDLNFACDNLSGDLANYNGVINKWVALAFKSRVCLYEGTFRKYHSVNPSTNTAWSNQYDTSDDFLREAADAAKKLIDDGGFKLVTGDPETLYAKIWRNTDVLSTCPEAIWTAEYDINELNVTHELTWCFNSGTYDQQPSPTKNLVRMFLNLDGSIAKPDVSVKEEFNNRDWRLKNTVMSEGHTYTDNNGATVLKKITSSYTYTGYQFMKWNMEREENFSKGRSDNDIPIFRLAEVMLNYAEAKAELGEMDETIWNETVGALRTRAGVANIYPGGGAYVEDTWLREYYGNPSISNVLLEIRRERATELILENLRVDDLWRWHCGNLIVDRGTDNKGWRGIYVTAEEYTNGLIFNGSQLDFKPSTNEYYNVTTSDANLNFTLSEGTYGYLTYNYQLEWKERNYVRPIPTSAYTLNQNLGQNYGWEE